MPPPWTETLEKHQVWFTAFAATIISVASVWVGILQWRTANTQERIAEAQALPVFEIHIDQIQNKATGKFDNSELRVEVVDGRAFKFSGSSAYFLDMTAATKAPPLQTITLSIPVDDYYNSTFVSPATKGRLLTETGNDNNKKFSALGAALRQESPKYSFVTTDERTYFHLTYDDLLGRSHSEFYRVFTIGGATQIDDAEGGNIFAAWNAAKQRLGLDQITPDFVYSKLDAASSR
jgi:hypothetical protein